MSETPKLTRINRLDSVPLEKVEYTPEGFLIDTPVVTSIGVFEYKNPDGSIRRELRLPEYVFDEKSLASYEGKPVIITHKAMYVSKDNAADEIVGTILSKGYADGEDVRAKIIIHDINSVKQSGFRKLSLGYDLTLIETPGEYNGMPYDAIQTDIVINHLAIVREARAGEQARLNIDSLENISLSKGEIIMSEKEQTTQAANETETRQTEQPAEVKPAVDSGGEGGGNGENGGGGEASAGTNIHKDEEPADLDKAKAVIAKLNIVIEELRKTVEELQAAKDVSDSETAITDNAETNKDEIKAINADSVDALVTERLKLGRLGDRLNLDSLETLKPLDAKKRVVLAIKPDLRLDGKSEHYIYTAFDIAVEELNRRKDTTYQRRQMYNTDGSQVTGKSKSEKARENMLARLKNGGNNNDTK